MGVVNRKELFEKQPFGIFTQDKKKRYKGVSFGLSEAGYDIRVKQGFWLHPFRRFKLASSIEKFTMPDDLVGIVHDKSTWARKGISVFNTVIEPGWEGYLTLEIVYHGIKPIYIPYGVGIAQVIFHKIAEPVKYSGKYQNQPNKPIQAIFKD